MGYYLYYSNHYVLSSYEFYVLSFNELSFFIVTIIIIIVIIIGEYGSVCGLSPVLHQPFLEALAPVAQVGADDLLEFVALLRLPLRAGLRVWAS